MKLNKYFQVGYWMAKEKLKIIPNIVENIKKDYSIISLISFVVVVESYTTSHQIFTFFN